jgi:hypothetical protein
VGITVVSSQPDGDVQKVDFFADDKLLGSAPDNGTGKFYFTWRNISIGTHCLMAVATDELGVTAKSDPVTIVVFEVSRSKKHDADLMSRLIPILIVITWTSALVCRGQMNSELCVAVSRKGSRRPDGVLG